MQRFRNILVGVDLAEGDRLVAHELTSATREAIYQSIWLAAQTGAKLTFSTALPIGALAEELIAADVEHLKESVDSVALKHLRAIQRQAREAGATHTEIHLSHERGWESILHKVQRDGHDLVIVGTREHTLLDRMLFGTTGVKLIRHCPCPVWLTKPGFSQREVPNILVADDLREVGFECLRLAVGGGQILRTRTHILHALEDYDVSAADDPLLKEELAAKIATAEAAIHQQLAMTDYRTLPEGVQLFVKPGRADEVIARAIVEYDIDLLIMGTAGRSGLSGFLVGNTVERLLSQIRCSVIAVKPSDISPSEPAE